MHIPFIGSAYSQKFTALFPADQYPVLRVSSSSSRTLFAVQLCDHGLEGLSIHLGDYLLFAQEGWPTREETVCLLAFGDDVIVRMVTDVYAMEPTLRVSGDRYPQMVRHRNDFTVQGQLIGVIREMDAEFASAPDESW